MRLGASPSTYAAPQGRPRSTLASLSCACSPLCRIQSKAALFSVPLSLASTWPHVQASDHKTSPPPQACTPFEIQTSNPPPHPWSCSGSLPHPLLQTHTYLPYPSEQTPRACRCCQSHTCLPAVLTNAATATSMPQASVAAHHHQHRQSLPIAKRWLTPPPRRESAGWQTQASPSPRWQGATAVSSGYPPTDHSRRRHRPPPLHRLQ
mmetsp:Transcript_61953/g.149073  ORF Transcript_61953/g.149073 Transcript_61953/m.149073 type:complete len:207 (+) Transcript_61953:2932-3552(+)